MKQPHAVPVAQYFRSRHKLLIHFSITRNLSAVGFDLPTCGPNSPLPQPDYFRQTLGI